MASGRELRTEPTRIDTDVLIVGGGVAGCLAAVEARAQGADVLVVDKAKMLERAGSVGGGVDQYLAAMGSGPVWDEPRYMLWHFPELTDDLVDMEIAERVVDEMPAVMRQVEGFGVDLTDPETGDYLRTQAFGFPKPYHFNFDGTQFKYHVARAAKKAGAMPLGRTMITDLLVDQATGRAYGAVGFNVRTAEWYVLRAGAVIVCTGDINRISRNLSDNPFDSWHLPYNTGDGHAAGFRVGAELVNMEFIEATLAPKGFSVQGTNSYVGLGGHFINRHGERFMFKYDPMGEKASRAILVEGVIQEVLAGNEPLYVDLRHLSDDVLDHFERTLQFDRYTLPGFFAQKGIDLRTQPIEVGLSEFQIRSGGSYMRGSGFRVDADGMTTVPGLYAAGDVSLIHGGIGSAAVTGVIAGRESAARLAARGDATRPTPDERVLTDLRAQMATPLDSSGPLWSAVEDDLREVVTRWAGYQRSDASLTLARERVARMKELGVDISAADLHDTMRAQETRNIVECIDMMLVSALARKDSRSGAGHRRIDTPQRLEEFTRNVVVWRQPDGHTGVRLDPVPAYARPAEPEAVTV